MIPHKKGIPSESFNLAEDTQWGFYALGKNPSLKKRYLFACLQAGHNLSRPTKTSNFFHVSPFGGVPQTCGAISKGGPL
jgi:hypothetical protein